MTIENRVRLYCMMVVLFPVMIAVLAVALNFDKSPLMLFFVPLAGFGGFGFLITAFDLNRRL